MSVWSAIDGKLVAFCCLILADNGRKLKRQKRESSQLTQQQKNKDVDVEEDDDEQDNNEMDNNKDPHENGENGIALDGWKLLVKIKSDWRWRWKCGRGKVGRRTGLYFIHLEKGII